MTEQTEFEGIVEQFEPSMRDQAQIILFHRKAQFWKNASALMMLSWLIFITPIAILAWRAAL